MHVVVLGAGVVGITTAYYLTEAGHTVTVVERASEVATGASGANGGQLSYSFTDAMASPALLSKLPWMVSGQDSAFRVRPPIGDLPVCWGWAFLQQCTAKRARENTLAVLEMSLRSAALIAELQAKVPLDFSFRRAGKLVLLNAYSDIQAAEKVCIAGRGIVFWGGSHAPASRRSVPVARVSPHGRLPRGRTRGTRLPLRVCQATR